MEDQARAPAEKAPKRKGKHRKDMFLGDGLEVLEKPGLKADDTMAEAARKTLLYHLQKMMLHEPGTRDGEDPEELHDMRVATRRMRAAMRVFEDYLAMAQFKPFLKVMRETGRELGAVRDLDVFMIKTQAYIHSLPSEAAGRARSFGRGMEGREGAGARGDARFPGPGRLSTLQGEVRGFSAGPRSRSGTDHRCRWRAGADPGGRRAAGRCLRQAGPRQSV